MLLRGNLYIRCIYARPVDILLIGLILTALSIAYPPDTKAADPVTAIGYGPLNYQLPNPGSYSLPPLGRAPNGSILDANGNPTLLHEIFGDDVILLSFMYSSCSDINGCPLSSYVLHKIKSAMQDDPGLAAGLKLVSLSFDPDTDTPEVMRLYGENFRFAGEAGQWDFITTNSLSELQPILNAYDQDVQRQVTNNTASGVEISHLLKVFLIDRRKQIRNIYSVSFLHPDLLINDVRTLLMESAKQQTETILVSATPTLSRPGDEKSGYEELDYETDSLALENRRGREMDLLQLVKSAPAGLPQVPQPEHNPITRSKVSLGRKLFYDRRLSINDTFSCAMCHVPEQGFTSNEIATAVGVEGRSVRRNTPTLYNIAYATRLFHDGREENLEQQVWGPLLAKNEMANPSVGYVLQKIRSLPDYDHLFEQAFDGRGAGMETVGMALASYQRTLVSANSPFDRWHYSNEEGALSESAQKGFLLFTGKAGCVTCHSIGDDHALFTDNAMHNTGIGYRNSLMNRPKSKRITLAPGIFIDVDQEIIDSVGEKPAADVGQYEITEDPSDRWKYRTPTLRNVQLTAPYMHNGELGTLREVVEFYNQGGVPNELLSPLVRPLDLSEEEIENLVAFMRSLTGDNVDDLVSDAFAAPVGDPGIKYH